MKRVWPLAFALLVSSCQHRDATTPERPAFVRDVQVPDAVAANQVLTVRMTVMLSNPCHEFARFEVTRNDSGLELRALQRDAGPPGGGCAGNIVSVPLEYADQPMPPRKSPFTVTVQNVDTGVPGSPTFTKTVRVQNP